MLNGTKNFKQILDLFFWGGGGFSCLNSIIIILHSSSIWQLSLVEHVPQQQSQLMYVDGLGHKGVSVLVLLLSTTCHISLESHVSC